MTVLRPRPPRPRLRRRLSIPVVRSLTASGWALLAGLTLCGLVMDPYVNSIYLLFGAGLGLVVFSALVAWWGRPRLAIRRQVPERVTAGEAFRYRLVIENKSRRAARDLVASEPEELVGNGRTLAWLERLAAGASRRIDIELTATRRGPHDLPGPTVASVFPFGLLRWGRPTPAPARVLVYPRPVLLGRLDIPLGSRHQPGGVPLASAVGEWGEFAGTRLFREGDSLRRIHWRSWARVGYPVVKEYQEEYFSRVAIVLDTQLPPRPSAADREAFEAAIGLVAGVADYFSRQELIIDVFAVGPFLYHVSAGRSLGLLDQVMEILACVEPGPSHSLEELESHMAEFVDQVGAAVVLLLDIDDRRARFLRSLASHGLALKAVVVRDEAPAFPPDLARRLTHITPAALAHPLEAL